MAWSAAKDNKKGTLSLSHTLLPTIIQERRLLSFEVRAALQCPPIYLCVCLESYRTVPTYQFRTYLRTTAVALPIVTAHNYCCAAAWYTPHPGQNKKNMARKKHQRAPAKKQTSTHTQNTQKTTRRLQATHRLLTIVHTITCTERTVTRTRTHRKKKKQQQHRRSNFAHFLSPAPANHPPCIHPLGTSGRMSIPPTQPDQPAKKKTVVGVRT